MRTSTALALLLFLPCLTVAQIEWTMHPVSSSFQGVTSSFAADVDNDGDMDLVAAVYDDYTVRWFENLDGGLNWNMHSVANDVTGINFVQPIDFDSDGDVDILASAAQANEVLWFENLNGVGTSWDIHIIVENIDGPCGALASDIDNDGDTDVVVCGIYYNDSKIFWYQNLDGNGLSWVGHQIESYFQYHFKINVADFDGDGDNDVVGSSYWSDQIKWWENLSGGFVWDEHLVDDNIGGVRFTTNADVNGDGNMDIVGSSYDDVVAWWDNINGNGTVWERRVIDPYYPSYFHTAVYDMDADGDMDVLCCDGGQGYDACWWENLGSGLNWAIHVIESDYPYLNSVYGVDLDLDGDADVVGNANTSSQHELVWWEQSGTPPPPDPIEITLFPATDPVVVPAGGFFSYDLVLQAHLDQPTFGFIWSEALLPNGNLYGPVYSTRLLLTPTMTIIVEDIYQYVPGFAPTGLYDWIVNAGPSMSVPIASDSFPFTVTAASLSLEPPATVWTSQGHERLDLSANRRQESDILLPPDRFLLEAAQPNPFNSLTAISVKLPEASDLSVTVHNIRGQIVMRLADGLTAAGTHRFVFDASGLASGVYFVRASLPNEQTQIQKVMLVR